MTSGVGATSFSDFSVVLVIGWRFGLRQLRGRALLREMEELPCSKHAINADPSVRRGFVLGVDDPLRGPWRRGAAVRKTP